MNKCVDDSVTRGYNPKRLDIGRAVCVCVCSTHVFARLKKAHLRVK